MRPYPAAGQAMSLGTPGAPDLVRALQRDLRSLGYLNSGIDGDFGAGTDHAVRALQFDLLHNNGQTSGSDGMAPVAIASFNARPGGGPAVAAVTGVVDADLAACIDGLLGDPRVIQVPASNDPTAQNTAAMQAIRAIGGASAPVPFILAIVQQESNGRHFCVPTPADPDNFVILGLDRNDAAQPEDHITSRGYGIGQYTLFHHPPRPEEVHNAILDPVRNVQQAFAELRDKFDRFVVGPADTADDRTAEHKLLPLRLCKYQPADPLYMRDCHACAMAARKVDIHRGTPAYSGATFGYQPDQYYPSAEYSQVPDRADFACDWPYAARRYNGSGNNSFHYQTRILLNLQNMQGGNP